MKSFKLSNPIFTIMRRSQDSLDFNISKFHLKLNIAQTQIISHSTSARMEEGKLIWPETFSFEKIPQKNKNIKISVVENNHDTVITGEGELNFDKILQTVQIYGGSKHSFDGTIELQLKYDRSQRMQEIDIEDIAKKFIMSIKKQAVNSSLDNKFITNENKDQQKQTVVQKQENCSQTEKAQQVHQQLFEIQTKSGNQCAQKIQKQQNNIETDYQKQTKLNLKKQLLQYSEKDQLRSSIQNKQNKYSQKEKTHKTKILQQHDISVRFQDASAKNSLLRQSHVDSSIREQIKMLRSRFGDKIYQNQSASTMQKTVLCFSVPKGPRFKDLKYNGVQPSYYVGTSFSSKNKGTSFGYGNRKPYPQWLVRNMHQNPAPNSYTVSQSEVHPSTTTKGFSFGIPYCYYEKTTLINCQKNRRSINKSLTSSLPKLHKSEKLSQSVVSLVDPNNHYHYRSKK